MNYRTVLTVRTEFLIKYYEIPYGTEDEVILSFIPDDIVLFQRRARGARRGARGAGW